MRSPLATLAILGSLAMCIDIVLGVRSYRGVDQLWQTRKPGDRVNVTSEFGKLVIEIEAPQRASIQRGWVHFDSPIPRLWSHPNNFGGFALFHGGVRHYLLLPPTPLWGLVVPHWFVSILCALPGIAWLTRHRRMLAHRLRLHRGLCGNCAYDLTGNQSGICPECGLRKATA